jgi:hypothetical protein
MKTASLLSLFLLGASLPAQYPPLPAQSYYSIGVPSWVIPCGPYFAKVSTTTSPTDRRPDNGYPGGAANFSCRIGGIFYLRAQQQWAVCVNPPIYQPLNSTVAPIFLFGANTSGGPVQLPTSLAYPSQNYVFDGLSLTAGPTHYGPWELIPSVDCWACAISVPNDPALNGTQWAAQAAFYTPATLLFHLSGSHYTRLVP